MPDKVFCVVVTYNPDIDYFLKVVKSILVNKVGLLIVDNGSSNQSQIKSLAIKEGSHFIGLEENVGIAAAQNRGIEFSFKNSCDYIWLSDQDTIYQPEFAVQMINSFSGVENVAAIGPTFFDNNKKIVHPIFVVDPLFKKKKPVKGLNNVSHMIASGMFIPANVFSKIGLKQENLFIDWVDTEWCWRSVNNYGFNLFVNGDVEVNHTLGDSVVKIFGKTIGFRTAFRHYFIVRNALALALYSKTPSVGARIELISRAVIWLVIYPLAAPEKKLQHLKATFTGFFHGLFNRLGPK